MMHNLMFVNADGDCDAAEILDARLRNILENIRLVYLLEREGGWDTSTNWEDMLSLGEQQRLGMVCMELLCFGSLPTLFFFP
jgi:ABC-type uncharacterized transport system fused permease/ATPase subunit